VQNGTVIRCATTEHVSLAHYQNAIPIVREISIENLSDEDLVDVSISISSHPQVIRPAVLRVDRIVSGQIHRIDTPNIHLDPVVGGGENPRLDGADGQSRPPSEIMATLLLG
jgi:hypothetical protein